MYLHRTTEQWDWTFPNEQPSAKSENFDVTESGLWVSVRFPRVGRGTKRKSDYEVAINWEDIETLVEKFCEAKNPKAIALRDAIKLADAAKKLGWQPPKTTPPQSN